MEMQLWHVQGSVPCCPVLCHFHAPTLAEQWGTQRRSISSIPLTQAFKEERKMTSQNCNDQLRGKAALPALAACPIAAARW